MKDLARPDDLRWLLVALALVLAPLARDLQWWVPAVAVMLGLWRLHIALRRWALPRLRWMLPLTLLGTTGIFVGYGSLFGRDASISLLLVMLALKLLESNSRRDLTIAVFLGYFICVTGFLFSQSILSGLYMVLPVIVLTATLAGIHHPNGSLVPAFKLRLSGMMLVQSMPLMLVLFVLFPRMPGPLWGVPQDAYRGMSGLSEDMSPGSISQLSRSDAVAFRAEFQGTPPPQQQRYWRGPVFWHYDGRTWRPGNEAQGLPVERVEQVAERVNYSVTLEPHNRRWLFMLDLPAITPADATLTHDYQLLARQPVRSRLRYAAGSHLDYRLQTALTDEMRARALQLPQDSNPQTRALGSRWRAEAPEPAEIARRALDMFRREPFVYTLTPPLLGADSVDQFLFSTRRGFCEHYAGSFVFLMRAAGVPARVVTGYQGGEFNPAGNYVLVTQAEAHAWAEIWLEDRGWVRVDPTAAVSPQRIELSMAAALPAGEPVPVMMRGDYAWLRKLYLNWDALNNHWNQWVLGYNQQRQMELLARLTGSILSWQDMAAALMATAGTLMLSIAVFLLRGRVLRDPLRHEWARFQRKLERHGVAPAADEGPLDFARRACGALPARGAAIRSIAVEYARLRYGAQPDAGSLARLRRDIRNFRI